MQKAKPTAVVFDAFGTLIRFGDAQHNPYRHFLKGCDKDPASRLPFLTRNLSADVFADELDLLHVMPEFRRELDEELAGLRLFDEVPTVITKVRAASLQLAVCSNLAFEYGVAVRQLLPNFDAHILSFEVGTAKPDHMIYAATCRALQCAPSEVVFIGDSKRCDYHSPQAFGMQVRWVDRRGGNSLLDALEGIA